MASESGDELKGVEGGVYGKVLDRALPYLQTRQNELHTKICHGFAAELLRQEGGKPGIVVPAVLLHDVGWSQVPEEEQLAAFGPDVTDPELTKVHERAGAKIAADVLQSLDFPAETIRAVTGIISGHDTRLTAESIEDAVVKDADKLFRFSREGFPIDAQRFGRQPADYLSWLEKQIEKWFFTETGKRLAREEAAARRRELRGNGL